MDPVCSWLIDNDIDKDLCVNSRNEYLMNAVILSYVLAEINIPQES